MIVFRKRDKETDERWTTEGKREDVDGRGGKGNRGKCGWDW